MTVALVIAHPDDAVANATYRALLARNGPAVRISRWRDLRLSCGCDGGEISDRGRRFALQEISLVFYRGIPAVHTGLSARTREYAQAEWQAALSTLTTLEHCPVLNSPYPANASGAEFFTTHGGRRRRLENLLVAGDPRSARITNLIPPPSGAAAFGLIAGGLATKKDIEWSESGLEILSIRLLASHIVPLYYIVDQSVVSEKSLDLRSGIVRPKSSGEAFRSFAERCARALRLQFGSLWLHPGVDGGCAPGGFDLFPPNRHLAGDEEKLAAAICDRYAFGNHASRTAVACADADAPNTEAPCDGY